MLGRCSGPSGGGAPSAGSAPTGAATGSGVFSGASAAARSEVRSSAGISGIGLDAIGPSSEASDRAQARSLADCSR